MIRKIDVTSQIVAKAILSVQIPAYTIEAIIIGYKDIPPLKDSILMLQQCDETFYGYYSKEVICGVISIKVEKDIIDIHRLVVHPDHFKRGIASRLLDFIERSIPHRLIKVATATKNTAAIQLYKKNGFNKIKEEIVSDQLSLSFFEKKMEGSSGERM